MYSTEIIELLATAKLKEGISVAQLGSGIFSPRGTAISYSAVYGTGHFLALHLY